MGSIRQGQGLNEAVCWAESTTGQTRTRPIDYCAFFVSQGPLTTYLGTVLYGYTARAISDTDLVQGLESTRKTHAHLCDIVYCGTVERYHLPSAPGHNWNHGTPFLNPGHIRRRDRNASFCSCSRSRSIRQRLSWTRLHNRRSFLIRPPLPPPHASGRPVTRPDHLVRILILKCQTMAHLGTHRFGV